MFKRNAMGSNRTKLIAGVVMLSLGLAAGSAMAANVYGGGATLPAGAYVGFNFLSASGIQKMSNNTGAGQSGAGISSTSIFGAWAAANSSTLGYCQTGSGNGKKIFDHYNGTTTLAGAVGTCDGTINPGSGFGAPTGVAVDPHFAGSDAPMSTAEFGWFNNGGKAATYGQPVQFPAIAGSVAIVYNNSDVKSQLALSRAQVCQVFSGQITNWQQIDATLPSKTISLVYRQDGSGTTFSLANYLATACPGSSASHFIVDQAFSTVVSKIAPSLGSGPVFGNGNPDLVDKVNANDGAIGYAEAANLKAAQAVGLDTSVAYATVEGFDPYANFPGSINLTGTVSDQAVGTPDPATGKVVLAALSPSVAGCMFVTNPNNYALVAGRYPIMAVSYLIANNKGNGTDVTAVRGLVGSVYSRAAGTVLPQGYAFVNPGAAVTGKVATCINS